MDEQKKGGGAWLWAVAVVVVALIAYGWYAYSNKNNNTALVNNTNTPAVTTPTDTTTPSLYKDGNYTATGNYNSPGGAEQVKVQLTLKNDMITAVNVTSLATRGESRQYQTRFIQGVSAQVLGKKITDVNLTRVSGSSLTPKGWNDAIAQIEAQAKV